MVRLLVDGDSLPRALRPLLLKAHERGRIQLEVCSLKSLPGIPVQLQTRPEPNRSVDHSIAARAQPGDLVLTRDVPLAERLVRLGISVVNDRGRVYTVESVAEYRSQRDATIALRADGLLQEGRRSAGAAELREFANALDRELARLEREKDS